MGGKYPCQPLSGVGLRILRNFLRRSHGDHLAAPVAALRSKVNHPIGNFDHVQIVLDDEDRAAGVDEAAESEQQLADVIEMQAGGRLVKNVENARQPACGLRRQAWGGSGRAVEGAPPTSCAGPRRHSAW